MIKTTSELEAGAGALQSGAVSASICFLLLPLQHENFREMTYSMILHDALCPVLSVSVPISIVLTATCGVATIVEELTKSRVNKQTRTSGKDARLKRGNSARAIVGATSNAILCSF